MSSQSVKMDNLANNAEVFIEKIADLAECLLGVEGFEQTAAAKAVVKEILDLEAEAKAYGAAWAAVANNYVVNDETTNFKQDLEGHATRLQPSLRSQLQQVYKDFCERLEDEDEEEEAQQQDDDIEVQIGGDSGAAPNAQCPLTMRPLLEIENPVADQKGYVYEKDAVEQYIRQNRGSIKCPATATSHMITIQDLKKAIKVLKMQRKQRMYGTQNQPQADVFDVE